MEKLKIEVIKDTEKVNDIMVRVTPKAYALVTDIAQKSGRSKAYIASKMIEFAYDHIELIGEITEEE